MIGEIELPLPEIERVPVLVNLPERAQGGRIVRICELTHDVIHLLESLCLFIKAINNHQNITYLIEYCGAAVAKCAFHQEPL